MTIDEVLADIQAKYERLGGELAPQEVRDLRKAIEKAVKNARGLQVLFSVRDHSAWMAVFALKQKFDYVYEGQRHTLH